jgi:hypothetical protein
MPGRHGKNVGGWQNKYQGVEPSCRQNDLDMGLAMREGRIARAN